MDLLGPMKEHRLENQQLLSTPMPDKEIEALDLQSRKPSKGAPCETLSARKSVPNAGSGGIVCADAECNKSTEKTDFQNIQENFNLYGNFLPSSIAAWRGQFQIFEAAASGKVYDGFKAQPPCTVNSKAYKFSSRMPSLLQLESLPMLNVLTDVFQNDCPTLQDIALYFFPSDDTEGSTKNFNSIFEFMNAEKLMLSSVISGVQLMVFTSNELNVDSRGTIATVNADEKDFLWGVFRRMKFDKDNKIKPEMEPVGMIGGKEVNIERSSEMEAVDMDVDMIGGKDVAGRTDHVKKDLSERFSRSLLHSTSKKEEEKIINMELGKKIKSEYSSDPSSLYKSVKDKLDVPPGFEARPWCSNM